MKNALVKLYIVCFSFNPPNINEFGCLGGGGRRSLNLGELNNGGLLILNELTKVEEGEGYLYPLNKCGRWSAEMGPEIPVQT